MITLISTAEVTQSVVFCYGSPIRPTEVGGKGHPVPTGTGHGAETSRWPAWGGSIAESRGSWPPEFFTEGSTGKEADSA